MRRFLLTLLVGALFARTAVAQTLVPAGNMLPTASLASVEEPAVRAILRQYQQAVEKLDTTGTHRLFAANSRVFESGGVEGTYRHYAAHHLAPELGEFSKFAFNNYRVVVEVDLPYAFATETYIYTINLKKGPKTPVVREGVATSVLRKSAAGQWQIVSTHTSAQKPQPKK